MSSPEIDQIQRPDPQKQPPLQTIPSTQEIERFRQMMQPPEERLKSQPGAGKSSGSYDPPEHERGPGVTANPFGSPSGGEDASEFAPRKEQRTAPAPDGKPLAPAGGIDPPRPDARSQTSSPPAGSRSGPTGSDSVLLPPAEGERRVLPTAEWQPTPARGIEQPRPGSAPGESTPQRPLPTGEWRSQGSVASSEPPRELRAAGGTPPPDPSIAAPSSQAASSPASSPADAGSMKAGEGRALPAAGQPMQGGGAGTGSGGSRGGGSQAGDALAVPQGGFGTGLPGATSGAASAFAPTAGQQMPSASQVTMEQFLRYVSQTVTGMTMTDGKFSAQLSAQVLPQTSLQVENLNGRIHVIFTTGSAEVLAFLHSQLPRLEQLLFKSTRKRSGEIEVIGASPSDVEILEGTSGQSEE